ncbi:MAG: glycosyltransferase [Acidobacteria bacterium]|nr:glycosyltransferase [Acidobacteriota bacterium]
MRIGYITAGAAGMYCGSCLHDNTLSAAMQRKGHDVALVPTYTPVRTDEEDVSIDRVFYGALNVYLEQKSSFFRNSPGFVHWLLDRKPVLNWVSRMAGTRATQGEELGELTLSMLQGEEGNQASELLRLVEWMRDEYRPEIIHITNSMLIGMAGSLKRTLNVPVVCSVQGEDIFLDDMVEPWRTRVREEMRAHAGDVDCIIAPSRYYATHMASYLGVNPDVMRVVPLGIKLDGHAEPEPHSDAFTIGYLARVCPEKGLHHLIDAFIQLAPESPQARLRIAGYQAARDDEYRNEQVQKIEAAGLSDRVDWLGEVDRQGKLELLHSLDVFCMPTVYHESKGLPVLEAMASGVPIVVPNHGAFPEIIEWTGGGALVEPNSPNALAAGIMEMAADPTQRSRLGDAARQAVHTKFSDDAMADATLHEYERLRCTN